MKNTITITLIINKLSVVRQGQLFWLNKAHTLSKLIILPTLLEQYDLIFHQRWHQLQQPVDHKPSRTHYGWNACKRYRSHRKYWLYYFLKYNYDIWYFHTLSGSYFSQRGSFSPEIITAWYSDIDSLPSFHCGRIRYTLQTVPCMSESIWKPLEKKIFWHTHLKFLQGEKEKKPVKNILTQNFQSLRTRTSCIHLTSLIRTPVSR